MPNARRPLWPTYRRLLQYVKPYRLALLLAMVGLALAGLTEPVLPYLLGKLLDSNFGPQQSTPLWMIPVALIGLFLIRGVLTFVTSYLLAWVSNKLLVDIRGQMFQRLLQLPASYFSQESAGKLVSRVVFEVNNLTLAATTALIAMVQETLVILGLLGLLIWYNWQLTLIVFALVPFIAWAISFAGKRVRRLSTEALSITRELSNVVEESVNGQKVIKVYAGQQREALRFARVNEKLRAYARRVSVAESAVTPVTHLLASFAVAAVVTIAVYQSRHAGVTVGTFAAYVTAMLMLLAPLKRVSSLNTNLQKGIASAEAVFELLDATPELDRGTIHLPRIKRQDLPNIERVNVKGRVKFIDVGLSYPDYDRPVLEHITFEVQPGEVIALVGPSGGGKTSLTNLLLRFTEPTSGEIFLDDHLVDEIRLSDLRAAISVVTQETMLFNDSVGANVVMGLGATLNWKDAETQVRAALQAANLLSVADALPQGLETPIGDNGNLLSGGQRQRLAIARALIKDAPILILDEATSALDNESERAVQEALSRLMKGRTTFVIAHRLSTILNADRILVLNQGRIVEQGNHQDLLKANGLYARLIELEER